MAKKNEIPSNEPAPGSTPKRQSVCKRVYTYVDGSEGNRAQPDATKLTFTFVDDAGVLVASLDDIGEKCREALAWHGLSQWIGDKFNTAKGDGVAALESALSGYETLVADSWVAIGVSAGPRIGMAVEAVKRALEADGQTVDDERVKGIAEKLSDKAVREATMAKSPYDFHLRTIQQEAAAKRTEAARAKMEEADSDLSEF